MTDTSSKSGVTGLSHIAIAVPDVDAAANVLERIFGLSAGPVMENAQQGVRMRRVPLGNVFVELLQPTGPDGPLSKFLARNPGGGLHHISLQTGPLDALVAAVRAAGVATLGQIGVNVDGQRMVFLKPSGVLGVLTELEESPDVKEHER